MSEYTKRQWRPARQDIAPRRQQLHRASVTPSTDLHQRNGRSTDQEKKYELAKGDQIDVIGAKSEVDGRDVLLVREVKKGSETMTFRDAKGFPMWSGRGRP